MSGQINIKKSGTHQIPVNGTRGFKFDEQGNPVIINEVGVAIPILVNNEINKVLPNIIANLGIGIADDLPTTFAINDIYVSSDTFKIFTAIDSISWNVTDLQVSQFVTDFFNAVLYQYNGTSLQEVTAGAGGLDFESYGAVMGDPTGTEFHPVRNPDTTTTFIDATRTFSITPTGVSFNIWIKGKKYTFTTAQSIVIPDVEGLCWIYFNASGVLTVVNSFDSAIILDYAIVKIIYWDAVNKKGKPFEERHGIKISGIDHLYKHIHIRAQYNEGLQISSITATGTGDLDTDAQFVISDGSFDDEDLLNLISATTLAGADKTIYYIGAGGAVRWFDNQSFPVRTFDGTSATRLCYNNHTTGALVQVASANYVLCHVVALNNGTTSFFIGQAEYTSIALARTGANEEALRLKTGLFDALTAEHVLLYTLIFQTNLIYTNTVNARVREVEAGISSYVDWRQTTITGNNGVTPTDHTLLTNLNSVNYTHITESQKAILAGGATTNADSLHKHTSQISDISGTGFETAPAMSSSLESVFKSATGWFKLAWSSIVTWLNTGQLLASSIINFQATVSVNTDVTNAKEYIEDNLELFVNDTDFLTAEEGVMNEGDIRHLKLQTPNKVAKLLYDESITLTLPSITGDSDEVYFYVIPDGCLVEQIVFIPSATTAFTTLEVGFYISGSYEILATFTYQANATRYISRLDTSIATNLTNTNIQIITPYYNNGDNGNVLLACTGFAAMAGTVNLTIKRI
ncbi:MAG: hypothetical protein IPO21_14385 [Bacteroidales bacterium]|nr:hypothetical protein [Bacteroidales bacterium]